jgi:hypothetical protein
MSKIFLLLSILLCPSLYLSILEAPPSRTKMEFWSTPKKGANIFNQTVKREDIRAAKSFGIQFVRLVPEKFISKERDFLIGK